MDLLDLVTKIRTQVYDKPIEALEHRLEKVQHRLEFLGAAEVARGLFELVEKFSGLGEQLQAAATSAGLTVVELQKLQYAGSMAAVSSEEMGTALTHLTRQLYAAKEGGAEAIKQFDDLGISREQLMGFKTGKDAMAAMADQLSRISDPIKKQALTMGLMGRSSSKMVGFLSKGSKAIDDMGKEALDLGAVLTGPQVHALAEVEDSLSQLWQVFRTFMAGLAASVAPAIQNVVHWFLELYKANRAFIQVRLNEWFQNITYAMGFVYGVVEALIIKFMRFAKEHEELVKWAGYLVLALGALSIAGGALSAGLAAGSAVLGALAVVVSPMVLTVAALATAFHDLWIALSGGRYEDTWFYKMTESLKQGFGGLLKDLGIAIDPSSMVIGGSGVPRSLMPDYGAGAEGEARTGIPSNIRRAHGNLGALADMLAPGGGSPLGAAKGTQPTTIDMNAPITINVPAGTDPKMVGQAAKDGVREHLDQLAREMRRSLKPAQAY